MGRRISLRDDFDAWALRHLAEQSGDANQTRRLLALASIHDGGKRLRRQDTGTGRVVPRCNTAMMQTSMKSPLMVLPVRMLF